jgi:hypothetical protein
MDLEILPQDFFKYYWKAIEETKDPLFWTKTLQQIFKEHPESFEKSKNK